MEWFGELLSFVKGFTTEALVWGFVALQVMALLSAPSVLLRRRGRPTAALSWLFALFAIPALGALAWWAFGRTRIERKLRKRTQKRRDFERLRRTPETLQAESTLLAAFAGALPERAQGSYAFTSPGNHVELLCDGQVAFERMYREMRQAKLSLHLLFYIFHLDETGEAVCQLLIERARAGVRVRLLLDGFGSAKTWRRIKKKLCPEGIEVAVFFPSRISPLSAPRFNFINHRKIIIIDQQVAFSGGMNIGDEYRNSWRDLMLFIDGPAALALCHVMLEDWFFATQITLDDPVGKHAGFSENSVETSVIASGPDTEPWIHDAYFTAITQAKKRLYLVTPYFIPTQSILTALRTAAGRGVDVRILIPERSDVELVKWASRSFYSMLVKTGVRIYEYSGAMLHAKALLMDDRVLSIGTANVDNRSFALNFEVSCFMVSVDLASQLEGWMLELFEDSNEMSEAFLMNKSLPRKLLESAAHLASPLL